MTLRGACGYYHAVIDTAELRTNFFDGQANPATIDKFVGGSLVDETNADDQTRVMVYLEHAIQDARTDRSGQRRVVSKQMQFVEIDSEGNATSAGYAPYLDYQLNLAGPAPAFPAGGRSAAGRDGQDQKP